MDIYQNADSSDEEIIYNINNIDVHSTILDMTSLSDIFHDPSGLTLLTDSGTSSDADEDDERLSLAYENLVYLPKVFINRYGPTIKILDLSHNKIQNLDFLVHFPNLHSYVGDNNPITENVTLPSMPKLKLLWLNHCKISKLHPWIKKLHNSCPRLKHLSLMGNLAAPSYLNGGTFYEYLQYRLYIISLFESLVYLDDRTITADQVSEAKRLYKRPLFERLSIFGNKDFPFNVPLGKECIFNFKFIQEKMNNVLGWNTNFENEPASSANRII